VFYAKDLIEKMISKEIEKRPNTEEILYHFLFWSKETILNFFCDLSDKLEDLSKTNKSSNNNIIINNQIPPGLENISNTFNWENNLDSAGLELLKGTHQFFKIDK
jgi:serine/threonine protein kinase